MITVFIADDHLMFREGLRTLLEHADGLKVAGEASDGHAAIKKIQELKPDVAVVDIAMPNLNGIEVTKRISKLSPETRVLILTMHADKFFAVEALKARAMGYLLKKESFTLLTDAIKAVHQGKIFVSPTLETSVLQDFVELGRQTKAKSGDNLTGREKEILQLIAEGLTNQKIADLLCISVGTVDTHRKNIMSKLDIHSVAGLVKYGIRHKIVTV